MTLSSPKRAVWLRRARNATIAAVVVAIVIGLLGFFVAPGIVRSVAERQITEQLGRKATIGSLKLNPYRLSASIDDFRLYEADGTSLAVEIRTLFADVSSASLFKRALVFDELRVVGPTLRVARLDTERFSFSDIVDRLARQPKSAEPFRFSVNNIQVDDGVVEIDDRVTDRKHRIDGIRVALPFLSNLPYDAAIFVTPEFAARVDGSAIALTGKAQPFSSTREAAVVLDVSGLDLTEYVGLSPTKLAFRVLSGKLAAKLSLTFRAATTDAAGQVVPQSMSVAGQVGLTALDLGDADGRSVVAAKAVDVDLTKLDPFNGDVVVRRVALTAPRVDVTRRPDGSIDLLDLFRFPASPAAAPPPASATVPNAPAPFSVAEIGIDDGAIRFVDRTLEAPTTTQVGNIDARLTGLVLRGATPTTYKLSMKSDEATLDAEGSAIVERRQVTGTIALKGFRPARLTPYLASLLAARIDDGTIDAAAHYAIDASGASPAGVVDRIALRVDRLRTSLPDDRAALLGADAIEIDGGAFDLQSRAFTADAIRLVAPAVVVRRDAQGRLNLRAAIVDAKPAAAAPQAATEATTPRGVAVTVKPDAAAAFSASIKSFAVERGDLRFEDLSVGTPVRVRAQPFDFRADNVGTATTAAIPFELATGIDGRGRLAVKGRVTAAPLNVEATIDASRVAVGWLGAYAGERLNVTVESADLDGKGTVRVAAGQGGDASPTVAYRGSLGIGRMRALDRTTSEEFVRWKTLSIPQVDLQMPAKSGPFALTLGEVALDDFYARLIVNANGRLNLQDVVATPGQRQSVTTPDAAPRAAPAPPPAASSAGPKPQIRIAGIKLTNGRIGITDNLIRPNYSANLTGLAGNVSAIASADPKPADLKLNGRIDGDGALDVTGRLDPFAPLERTDIQAEAKDIELTRLTPYAVKYAGYAIDRGKLSMTVKYHIENGRLDAQNRLFLDQLTFGEKVESPTATKLPVLLAVALLKNSRGEIDVNLPISGSLSDPEFSVGGVIARVILNLLTRALRSPFSLIASAIGAAGGSADELGYVQFEPGVSDLAPQGKAKLETLAKALADRPQLKLDIIGRFDPATDPQGIKRDHLLDRLKDLKAKDLSKSGERVGRDETTIGPDEYAKYLARVYDDTKLPDKPRNVVGIAKTIPVDQMESRLIASIQLDDNDPRWLAEARADVVRHYIEDTGKVSPSRVFLVTPKLNASGIDDQGVPNRVDFALR